MANKHSPALFLCIAALGLAIASPLVQAESTLTCGVTASQLVEQCVAALRKVTPIDGNPVPQMSQLRENVQDRVCFEPIDFFSSRADAPDTPLEADCTVGPPGPYGAATVFIHDANGKVYFNDRNN